MSYEHSWSDQPFRSAACSTPVNSWLKWPWIISKALCLEYDLPVFSLHVYWYQSIEKLRHAVFCFCVSANSRHIWKRWKRWCFGRPGKVTANKCELRNLQQAFRLLLSFPSLLPGSLLPYAIAEEPLKRGMFCCLHTLMFHVAPSLPHYCLQGKQHKDESV